MKTISQDLSAIRSDIFTTLAIAALLHESDEAVRACAKQLINKAPRSICKNTLFPLSISREALSIIMDEVVYPTQEKHIGQVWVNGYEYDLFIIYRDVLFYEIKDMVDTIVQKFVQRGIVTGCLKMSFRYFVRRGFFTHSVDMAQASVVRGSYSHEYVEDTLDA